MKLSILFHLGIENTPARLRTLVNQVNHIIHYTATLYYEDNVIVHDLIDLAMEKVTKYRDIIPQSDTLQKLLNYKIRIEHKSIKHLTGAGRVLIYECVNNGICNR